MMYVPDETESTKRRFSQVHDRYQITDPICGLVGTATSIGDALRSAATHACDGVQVFDTMARKKGIELWDGKTGKPLARKEAGQG